MKAVGINKEYLGSYLRAESYLFAFCFVLIAGKVFGFTSAPQQADSKLLYYKVQSEQWATMRPPQGGYGTIRDIDDDNNPALDFSVLSFNYKDALIEKSSLKSPSSGTKAFLLLIHRDYDPAKEQIIEDIRKEINKRPFRVEIFGEFDSRPLERNGVNYAGTIKLRSILIYDSLQDFATPCEGPFPGRPYTIEGVFGGVSGGIIR
jgi:hypothetical protein